MYLSTSGSCAIKAAALSSAHSTLAENCANCGCSTNGERLCRACINHRMCRRCRRYLPTHRYDGDDETTCRTCRNIRPENLHRYALQNAAAQHSWNGNHDEIDVADFLRQRADEIASTYSSAIDEHRSTKYFFRLEVEFSRNVSDDDDTTTVQRTTGLFATSPTTSATDPTIDFETLISTFENAIEGFTSLGSNWTVDKISRLTMHVGTFRPLDGSSFIPTPPALAGKMALKTSRTWATTGVFNIPYWPAYTRSKRMHNARDRM